MNKGDEIRTMIPLTEGHSVDVYTDEFFEGISDNDETCALRFTTSIGEYSMSDFPLESLKVLGDFLLAVHKEWKEETAQYEQEAENEQYEQQRIEAHLDHERRTEKEDGENAK